VKILLDECLPRPLAREIPGHQVRTGPEMGWAGATNGRLLELMEGVFDVFITVDRNLVFREKIANLKTAVIVLYSKSNRLDDLRPLMPEVSRILRTIRKGQVVQLGL